MINILIAESLHTPTLKQLAMQHGFALYDQIPPSYLNSKTGIACIYQPDITSAALEKGLAPYNGLVVRPKEVTAAAIRNAPHLKLIVRGGAGLNAIDLKAAKAQGVVVENTPGQNAVSTAEYTFALLMELIGNRQIHRADQDTRNNTPKPPEAYTGNELAGKTIAIIGYGHIGSKVAARAAAFEMQVVICNRSQKPVPYPLYTSIDALLDTKPDIISLHIPLHRGTQYFLQKTHFHRMKKGTILINCARPQLIDPHAFAIALSDGTLKSFAIDGDPALVAPFIKADPHHQGIITHHIADTTTEAQAKITTQVVTQLLAFFREGKVINGHL